MPHAERIVVGNSELTPAGIGVLEKLVELWELSHRDDLPAHECKRITREAKDMDALIRAAPRDLLFRDREPES